jgi:uncharacterized protein with HEPN domain
MQRDPHAFLWDVQASATQIQGFVAGLDATSYAANAMAQAAVERKFEIIGEALNQLAKLDLRSWQAASPICRESSHFAINLSMAMPA